MHRQPCLSEFAVLDPVGLHSGAAASFSGLGIGPREGKTKPSAVALERVVIDDNANVGPLLSNLGDLRRVSLACYRSVALFVVPDIVRSDADRDQIILALMPDQFPVIE